MIQASSATAPSLATRGHEQDRARRGIDANGAVVTRAEGQGASVSAAKGDGIFADATFV